MQELDAAQAWEAHNVLLRRHIPAVLADLA
jgi:hypothetical protein